MVDKGRAGSDGSLFSNGTEGSTIAGGTEVARLCVLAVSAF